MRPIYFVWFLVPFFLFALAMSASFRQAANTLKEGYIGFYLRQGIYSLVAFGVAVLIDKTVFLDFADAVFPMFSDDVSTATTILSWVIYPAVLTVFVWVGALFKKKNPPKPSKQIYKR